MDHCSLKDAVTLRNIVWQKHALARMLERGISRQMVITCLQEGSIIESYELDKPLPSALVLGFFDGQPLHVVAALDEPAQLCYIVTVYRPDPKYFEADYMTRRSP